MENFNNNYDPAGASGPSSSAAAPLRDNDWDEAKARVQKVYGRHYVCFAFLINGTCKCAKQSHLGHPEEQRGAFGVNYAGTPPPSELVTNDSGMKRRRMPSEDPFSSMKRRRLDRAGPLRGDDWDEAKERVIKTYGRRMVCFAFLINGSCKCQEDSHLDHPEEQRGVFGVNFTGKIPSPISARPISARPISARRNVMFGSIPRPRERVSSFISGSRVGYQEPSPFPSQPPPPLKGKAWDEAVARVKATFGSEFICFSYLINSTCNCGPGSRFKHPEGEAGAFGVFFNSLPKRVESQYYNPAEDAFYPPKQPSFREPLPLPLPIPRSLPIARPMNSMMVMEDRMRVPVPRQAGPKRNLRGEEWEEGMERVKDHFGAKFVCFSYLINGHCKCDGSKKFPHPPGLAGSFGVNMLAENQKCFDFNVNGSCKLQGCPSKHEYWSLDEAITKMRVLGKETNGKEKRLARKISAKLDELEKADPSLTTAFEALRELLHPLKESEPWRKNKSRSRADSNRGQERPMKSEGFDRSTDYSALQELTLVQSRKDSGLTLIQSRKDSGLTIIQSRKDSSASYDPVEDSKVNREKLH